jgi:hypothetical protein
VTWRVGGEWTSERPFYLDVPLNPLVGLMISVARSPEAEDPAGTGPSP